MNIGEAVSEMKRGGRVTRAGWNGRGMWIALCYPGDYQMTMSVPYVYMYTAQGEFVPWLASQTDLLADDWTLA